MGGDILYRWGNPQTYRAGSAADQRFFGQHNAQWIASGLPGAGHILVFNNGGDRPPPAYSTVDEFVPTSDSTGCYPRPQPRTPHGPVGTCWQYHADPPTSFFSGSFGGAQRMPGGNTLICEGTTGLLFEVTSDCRTVWQYADPATQAGPMYQGEKNIQASVFRSPRYAQDYPGLTGRDLTPGYPVEKYRPPRSIAVAEEHSAPRRDGVGLDALPNPFRQIVSFHLMPSVDHRSELQVLDVAGRPVRTLRVPRSTSGTAAHISWDGTDDAGNPVGQGVYYCRLQGPGFSPSRKLVKAD
jgi:hypothetical protein